MNIIFEFIVQYNLLQFPNFVSSLMSHSSGNTFTVFLNFPSLVGSTMDMKHPKYSQVSDNYIAIGLWWHYWCICSFPISMFIPDTDFQAVFLIPLIRHKLCVSIGHRYFKGRLIWVLFLEFIYPSRNIAQEFELFIPEFLCKMITPRTPFSFRNGSERSSWTSENPNFCEGRNLALISTIFLNCIIFKSMTGV